MKDINEESKKEFNEAINKLKSYGFCKSKLSFDNYIIFKYNFNGKFKKYSNNDLLKFFKKLFLNPFELNYNIESIIKHLPIIDKKAIEGYYKYLEAKSKDNIDYDVLLKEFEKYEEKNSKLKVADFNPHYWNPKEISQFLINNDVYTDGTKFYQFKDNTLKRMNINDLSDLVPNELKTIPKATGTIYLTRSNFSYNIPSITSKLVNIYPVADKFINYYSVKHHLEIYENDYNSVMAVINKF